MKTRRKNKVAATSSGSTCTTAKTEGGDFLHWCIEPHTLTQRQIGAHLFHFKNNSHKYSRVAAVGARTTHTTPILFMSDFFPLLFAAMYGTTVDRKKTSHHLFLSLSPFLYPGHVSKHAKCPWWASFFLRVYVLYLSAAVGLWLLGRYHKAPQYIHSTRPKTRLFFPLSPPHLHSTRKGRRILQ